MKNKKKSIAIIMMVLSTCLVLLSGCKWNNEKTIKKVEAKLQEKYSESFNVKTIGDRLGTDYTKLTCYPTNNKDLIFDVTYYDNGEMEDNYILRKYTYELQKELEADLKGINVEAVSQIYISANKMDKNKNYANMSVNEYLKDLEAKQFTIPVAIDLKDVKTEKDAENITRVVESYSNKHGSIKIAVSLYFVKDEQYNEVRDYFKNQTLVTSTVMDRYIQNSDKSKRNTVITVNEVKGKTEVHPVSIMEAITVN